MFSERNPMVIEWLKFQVPPDSREVFIQVDDQIWSAALSTFPGYLGKTIWLDPGDQSVVILIIQWASREQWKSVPESELEIIEQRFDQALDFDYDMIESKEFQVRRFATPSDL